ncbi:MAG: glycerol-3-phosphate dehydrogenase/oxidase [Leptospiraceae bacterium]|nr:glycerol-3-phosphate dehydrogenase/oxidase [Leptospiraceae bacterium]
MPPRKKRPQAKTRSAKQQTRHPDSGANKPERLDLLVIGGGISGASILYDATQRGLTSLLVEKSDFASGTSQASSRLIHGGLRYLQNMEFGMVRESLRERRNLGRLAPHCIRPLGFLFAKQRGRGTSLALVRIGLWLYDLLSFDRNRRIHQRLHLPRSRYLSPAACVAQEFRLPVHQLTGGVLYYDYQNQSPERFTWEFIQAAQQKGGRAWNYCKLDSLEYDPTSGLYTAVIARSQTKDQITVQSRSVINAAGPWADIVQRLTQGSQSHTRIQRSMGIHIVTRKIAQDHCVVLMRPDGRHLFIIPWHNRSLIGTTDALYTGHPDDFRVTRADIAGLIADVNEAWPMANLELNDVLYYYGGLRPLVEAENTAHAPGDDDKKGSYGASRRMEIEDHGKDGLPGFITVLGGKYTTSRLLAEKSIDLICRHLGVAATCQTLAQPLPGGDYQDIQDLTAVHQARFGHLATKQQLAVLTGRYGALVPEIMATGLPSALQTLECAAANGDIYYARELLWIIQNESVYNVSDLLLRRTNLGFFGDPGAVCQKNLLRLFAHTHQWGPAELRRARSEWQALYLLPPEA